MKLIQGDCLEEMKKIADRSVDLILQDPPYNITACKWEWDIMTRIDEFWAEWKRILKNGGSIVMTASQPFTSKLVMSNLEMFKYEWIWEKAVGSNFATLKYQPMKEHENIVVFAEGRTKYNPQMQERKGSGADRIKMPFKENSEKGGEATNKMKRNNAGKVYSELRYPSSVQFFNNRESRNGSLNPTQKPVALMEYLIKTYTDEGDTVFDGFMGSGTTGVACKKLGREFIGIELNPEYFEIAKKRIESTPASLFNS